MRLWSYQLIESGVLPDKMLVSQWRECIAIKRQWKKGTLKHRLVSYVMDYHKMFFWDYINRVCIQMKNKNIKYNKKYRDEFYEWCDVAHCIMKPPILNYREHDDRYLKQCLYNLQEKADRGIITKEEWQKIEDKFGGVM